MDGVWSPFITVGDLFRRVADTKIGQIGSFQTGDKNILHHQAVWMSHALPSGKHTKNYGKSQFLMGKLTISMAIFNSYVTNYQRVNKKIWLEIGPWT